MVIHQLPGDELIPTPRKIITHSITIKAPSEMVWPWLVQLGAGRAGWYSYDRIDNGGVPSAKIIIPELQDNSVGDIMPALPGTKDAFIIQQILPGKALVLIVPIKSAVEEPDTFLWMNGSLRLSWALTLENIDPEKTRLISRGRISNDWLSHLSNDTVRIKSQIFIEQVYSLLAKLPWSLIAPIAAIGHLFMETKMLRGVKKRAEAMVRNK